MKTVSYNPSPLEVDFANAMQILSQEIEKHVQDNKIIKTEPDLSKDNPTVKFYLVDKDGDRHEIVIKVVQLPDKY
ncbi:MAG TPA: hypothetical protein PKJ63_05595 [Cyclobacteriaceae bacterium]|nr:hypothetical protein [Cyclobacteriaceae bacterium]